MSTKYKTTGCAKFFLILVILAPLAYVGASYFNGQDGIENIKGIFGTSKNANEDDGGEDIYKLKNQLSKHQKMLSFLRRKCIDSKGIGSMSIREGLIFKL
ncbi:MAG: hypothetical protein IPL46_11535 [Saprospiraceae bacterium]|nr:hypothetical protein [Saprospiraceae bacterium]